MFNFGFIIVALCTFQMTNKIQMIGCCQPFRMSSSDNDDDQNQDDDQDSDNHSSSDLECLDEFDDFDNLFLAQEQEKEQERLDRLSKKTPNQPDQPNQDHPIGPCKPPYSIGIEPGSEFFKTNELEAVFQCTETQSKAIAFVVQESKTNSALAQQSVLTKFTTLGYTEQDLFRTIDYIKAEAPLIIHLSLQKTLSSLISDTHYRNQFETNKSGGTLSHSARIQWEDRLFNNLYHSASPFERVKYGVLNIVNDPAGLVCCAAYGESYLLLRGVRLRTSFASGDTSQIVKLGSCENYLHVLDSFTDPELKETIDVALGLKPVGSGNVVTVYKECQFHGEIRLNRDVEALVIGKIHTRESEIGKLCEVFSGVHQIPLIWLCDM